MAVPVLLPKQGNTVESCIILEWKRKKGEQIKKGEVICEIETDKAVFEIESPDSGIILETFFNEGDDVPVLTNIAVIGNIGDDFDKYTPGQKKTKSGTHDEENIDSVDGISLASSENENIKKDAITGSDSDKKKISPRAKYLLDKYKLSADKIEGTGPGNRIIERDVLAASRSYGSPTSGDDDLSDEAKIHPATGTGDEPALENIVHPPIYNLEEENIKVVPLRGIRKIIAERMLESLKNSAQLTLNSSADARALLSLRKRFKNSTLYKKFQEVTINDLIHFAVIKTLPEHPELNNLLVEDRIEYYNKIHLGFAVDTQRGLVVPVIRNSQDLNLLQLSNEAKRLISVSVSGNIDTDELKGATFTITNLGNFGIESFTPVLNLPQTAILGVNTITLKPIEIEDNIEFVPHISFSLTIDHRAIDGSAGARFLQSLAKTIAEIEMVVTADTMKQ